MSPKQMVARECNVLCRGQPDKRGEVILITQQMPQHYVKYDEEDMEYLHDGGGRASQWTVQNTCTVQSCFPGYYG